MLSRQITSLPNEVSLTKIEKYNPYLPNEFFCSKGGSETDNFLMPYKIRPEINTRLRTPQRENTSEYQFKNILLYPEIRDTLYYSIYQFLKTIYSLLNLITIYEI